MLKIENSIRVDLKQQNKRGHNKRVYIFKCSNCPNEFATVKYYFNRHKGECKTCSKKRVMKENGGIRKKRPFEARYNAFIAKTKHETIKTDISYEDYLEYTKIPNCTYCERSIKWEAHGENTPGFFLDRKDNNRGHTKDNVTVCCGICNSTKRNYFTFEEFLKIGKILKEIRLEREK